MTQSETGAPPRITLREITDANRSQVEALTVTDAQRAFVASVAESLVEAAETPGACPWYRAVYAEETPVGFVMISDNIPPERREYLGPYFLWRLIVDVEWQRQGIGRATLDLVLDYVRTRPNAERLLTSYVPGEGSPIGFYLEHGFTPTGEIFDGEPVLEHPLGPPSRRRRRGARGPKRTRDPLASPARSRGLRLRSGGPVSETPTPASGSGRVISDSAMRKWRKRKRRLRRRLRRAGDLLLVALGVFVVVFALHKSGGGGGDGGGGGSAATTVDPQKGGLVKKYPPGLDVTLQKCQYINFKSQATVFVRNHTPKAQTYYIDVIFKNGKLKYAEGIARWEHLPGGETIHLYPRAQNAKKAPTDLTCKIVSVERF